MKILAFESSCDETSCAVIEDGRHILSDVISTQVPIHKKFGGVVPEIASRHHIEDVLPVAIEALEEAHLGWQDIDAIAVTQGPGLVGALLVGVAAAKSAAWALGKPLIAVNHMEGHIFANLLQYPDLEPPFLALVVSGGHTMIVIVKDYNTFQLLGQTTVWRRKETRMPSISRWDLEKSTPMISPSADSNQRSSITSIRPK